jgi:HSP20 family molecular chaperone IbpA
MSRNSFSQKYPPNCLVDYEKAHHMDSYQQHGPRRPTTVPDTHPSTIHYTTSSWAPKLSWPRFLHPSHHVHFPATSTQAHTFASHIENIHSPSKSFVPVYSYMPWVPDTDIRETRVAYHIEIEVPNVTDKHNTSIQCLSDRTLLVQGNAGRPDIEDDGDVEGVREGERMKEPQEVGPIPAAGSSPETLSPLEKVGLEWSELRRRQDNEEAVNGDGLKQARPKDAGLNGVSRRDEPTFLLRERKIGPWQRTFTLPLDVDLKALRAKLSGGLLSIDLPKRDISKDPTAKIEVQ